MESGTIPGRDPTPADPIIDRIIKDKLVKANTDVANIKSKGA